MDISGYLEREIPLSFSNPMSIGSKVENALRVTFESLNVVRLNVGHSEFRTHLRALVKLTLSTRYSPE
jgi:hypothetical protein